jgi:hypothetical protein
LIITDSSVNNIIKIKEQMSGLFKMSDLGLLSYYLGIEVKHGSEGVTLSQGNYAKKILEKAGLEDCRSCVVPMQQKMKLKKGSDTPAVDATSYISLVGNLRYLVNTRPYLSFYVGYVSRFMEEPHEEHLSAVKYINRFVVGTWNVGLFYPKKRSDRAELPGYSDSDLTGDLDSRKSTSGVLFFFGKSPIYWQSIKQRVMALSSYEAKYISAATAACQPIWVTRLLSELKDSEISVTVLRIDNKSTISLVNNSVYHDRSKHIDVRSHLIREYENSGQITVEYIRSEEQLADILTKPLGKEKSNELSSKIGLKTVTG